MLFNGVKKTPRGSVCVHHRVCDSGFDSKQFIIFGTPECWAPSHITSSSIHSLNYELKKGSAED